ncbi:UDP-glucose 4-epimerase family protein [Pseudomonas tohonis]|uniref:UDP-glucose 4-epimerase family protein n=1 Tax=Pseudomonas tohonis TaxID=2725477 RepID=UPI0021D922EF|nr:SDR family oxidoreductase [Pseudomonas tohonis]UXY54478.1 SDR family oxidoreductase [Pseudomonas tohonis]
MKRCLVTGASGFVGRALVKSLMLMGRYHVRAAVRRFSPDLSGLCTDSYIIGEINQSTDWQGALESIDVVVHCAARVHVMSGDKADDFFDEVNFLGSLKLARQAASSGVRRFIFISSIKVNGECTAFDEAFSNISIPAPSDAYARSKFRAELGLQEISNETGMEVVIIRPPLVYGPGVGANFLTMIRWLQRGFPLPLGGVDNRRSLVYIGNLTNLIVRCLDHPAAGGKIFLVSDDEDMSTSVLLCRLGLALGKPARLVSMPVALLLVGASLLRRRGMAQRLCGSLCVDITETKRTLSWNPPYKTQDALNETAKYYLGQDAS